MGTEQSKIGPALGRQLRRLRKRKGWTQQRLSDELEKLGHVIHPTAILKIEKGIRAVTVDEFLALAAALNVPPPLLLLPLGEEDTVQITKKSKIHPHLALDWVTGDECLVSTERKVIRRGEWLEGSEPLRLYRTLRVVQDELGHVEAWIRRAEYAGDAEQKREAKSTHVEALEAFHAHQERMQAAGVRPPGHTPQRLADMQAVGLDVAGLRVWEEPEQEGE